MSDLACVRIGTATIHAAVEDEEEGAYTTLCGRSQRRRAVRDLGDDLGRVTCKACRRLLARRDPTLAEE